MSDNSQSYCSMADPDLELSAGPVFLSVKTAWRSRNGEEFSCSVFPPFFPASVATVKEPLAKVALYAKNNTNCLMRIFLLQAEKKFNCNVETKLICEYRLPCRLFFLQRFFTFFFGRHGPSPRSTTAVYSFQSRFGSVAVLVAARIL